MDIFGNPITLNYNRSKTNNTWEGSIFTLFVIGFAIFEFYFFSKDMF